MAVGTTDPRSPGVSSPDGSRLPFKLKVFVSYSREDVAFADQLASGLRLCGFEPFVDRHDVAGGEAWQQRLGQLIRDADTVVFVLTPASAGSPVCAWEVAEAQRLNKRLLPVLCRPLEGTSPPEALRDLSYIFFYAEPSVPGAGFGQGLTELVTALSTNIEWLREHTRLLQRAEEWAAAGRSANRMLSGSDIEAAKAWAASRPVGAPPPTELHLEYLRASEADEAARFNAERQKLEAIAQAQAERGKALEIAEVATQKRARLRVSAFAALTVAAAVAGWQWWRAVEANSIVLKERDLAEVARGAAENARRDATSARDLAEQERIRAVELRTRQLLVTSAQRTASGDSVGGITLALEAVPGDTKVGVTAPAAVERALDSALRGLHEAIVFRGHEGPVRRAVFVGGGNYVLSTGDDGSVRLFDSVTGRQLKAFMRDGGEFRDIWMTDDGKYVGALGHQFGVVWNAETSVKVREFGGVKETSLVRAIAGTHRVIVATEGVGVSSVDILTGDAVQLGGNGLTSSDGQPTYNSKSKEVHSTSVVSPDGRVLLLKPDCRLIDTVSGREIAKLADSESCGRAHFTRNGSFVILRNSKSAKNAAIYNARTGERVGNVSQDIDLGWLVLSDNGSTLAHSHLVVGDETKERVVQFFSLRNSQTKLVSTFRSVDQVKRDLSEMPIGLLEDEQYSVRFEASGSLAVIKPHSRDSTIWSVSDGREVVRLTASSATFSNSGSLYATGLGSEEIELRRSAGGSMVAKLAGHRHNINSIDFSADDTAVLTGSSDGTVRLWRLNPLLRPLEIAADPSVATAAEDRMKRQIQDLQFSCDGERLLFSHNYSSSTLYDTNRSKTHTFIEHGAQTNSGLFLDCDRYALPIIVDGQEELGLFDARSGKRLGAFKLPRKPDTKRSWQSQIASFGASGWLFSANRKSLLGFERGTGTIHIWLVQDQKHIVTLDALDLGKKPWLRISPAGNMAIAGGEGGRIVALEIPSGRIVREWQDWEAWKDGFVWSSDGLRIARKDGIWDLSSWTRVVALIVEENCGAVRGWSEQTAQVAFSLRDTSNVCLYSSETGKLTWAVDRSYPEAHTREITWLAFAAEGTRLVTLSTDDTARVWDTKSGKRVAVIGAAFRSYDQKFVIRSDGPQLDSTDDRKTFVTGHSDAIRVWDAYTGAVRAEFKHGLGYLNSLAISGDGTRIAASDQDGGARLWPRIADANTLVERAMKAVPRCLDGEEREELGLDTSPPEWCLRHRKWPYGHRRVGIELELKPGDSGYVRGNDAAAAAGVKILKVLRHLPGAEGGLENGDVIVAINGKAVETATEATEAINALPSGKGAEFKVLRIGVDLKLLVTPQD